MSKFSMAGIIAALAAGFSVPTPARRGPSASGHNGGNQHPQGFKASKRKASNKAASKARRQGRK